MTALLYATVYAPDNLPTEEAHIVSKSLGTVNEASELELKKHLRGTGSIKISINRHHPQAALLQRDRYLIVHSVAGPQGGGFLDDALVDLSHDDGPDAEMLTWTGKGPMAILRNGRMDATSNIFGGHHPIDGYWDLDNQGPLAGDSNGHPIPMMKRALVEMLLNSPSGLAVVDHSSFDYDLDSAGAAVPFIPGEVEGAQVGDDGLSLIIQMSQLSGVIFQMSYLFKLDAYLTLGTDLSGDFGPDTVRFEKGVNVAAAVQRKVRAAVHWSHVIVGGMERTYVTVADPDYAPGDVVRWGFVSVPETSDPDGLEAAGLEQIEARKRQTDTFSFPQHDHGDDPEAGIYEPGVHYDLGDIVSHHTGTGQYDAEEQASPVAAIAWVLKTGDEANGDYTVTPDIGSTFAWDGESSFTGDAPGSQHRFLLCPPAVEGTPDTELYHLHFTAGQETVATYPSGTGLWPITAARWEATPDSDGSGGSIWFTLAGTGGGSPELPATAGVTYRIELDSYYGGGIAIKFYNASAVLLLSEQMYAHLEGTVWVPRTYEVTAPATTAFMELDPISAGRYDHVRITAVGTGTEAENPHAGTSPRVARCDHSHPAEDHEHDDEYAPLGHNHLLDDLADVDMATTPPTDGQVPLYDAATDTWLPGDPPGGGPDLSDDTPLVESGAGDAGTSPDASRSDHVHPEDGAGGGGDPYSLLIDEDGTSFANFTGGTGTWASDGTLINQTNASAGTYWRAGYNTPLAFGRPLVIQADVRINSVVGSSNFLAGIGVLSSGAAGNGGPAVYIDDGNRFSYGNSGSTLTILVAPVVINQGTWYTIRMALNGDIWSFWLDGVFMGQVVLIPSRGGDEFALIAYQADASYRNIKLWAPAFPA